MTAAAWAVPFLALAIVAAWAARGRISAAVLRARWAWRCRGHPPVPGDGKGCLSEQEFLACLVIELRRKRTAPEPGRPP